MQRAFRWLLVFTLFGLIWPAAAITGAAQTDERYEDPAGRFSVPVPAGWSVEEAVGYGVLTAPDDGITISVLAVEEGDPATAIATAWEIVEPGFAMEPIQTTPLPPPPGMDDAVAITYDVGQESGEIVQAVGQVVSGVTYVLLVRADVVAAQERASQINIVVSGFEIADLEQVNLEGVAPLPVEGAIVDELETYIGETMELLDVPGATIAIVQDGEVVYRGAFGVTDLDSGEVMTPETRMMVGSTTKPVTTMMLATLVDDGIISWDMPVVDILPSFAVADPELTPTITVRDLVCACTGVPRRDLELIFNFNQLTARDIVESLAEFEFFTPIGEAFQYSNQMVAAAGFVGAVAVAGEDVDFHDAYVAAVTERVLDPIGMAQSTFSFDAVEAEGNHATPHGLDLDDEYVTISLGLEEFVVPVAPSGGLWSNVDDMSQFMLTQLAHGTAPDGTTVVSAENLERTWEPQVPVSAETSYGLGWFVDSYKGQPMMHHGGNTLGFTSDLAFLPDAGIGIIVLTNGQGTNLFNEAVRYRLLELVFEQEPEFQGQVEAILEGEASDTEAETGVPVAAATPVEVTAPVDPADVEPFVGTWANDALGTATLELDEGRLYLDAGEFRAELVRAPDAPEGVAGYYMVDPPLAGLPIELRAGDDGAVSLIIPGPTPYVFFPVAAGDATPSASPLATPAA